MANQPKNSSYISRNRQRMTLKIKKDSMQQLDELAKNMECSRTTAMEECIDFVYKNWKEKIKDVSGNV
jgi:predicted transcriptional regulator